MKEVISQKKICIAKIVVIICPKKAQDGWPCLKPQKIRTVGLFNVITISAKFTMFLKIKKTQKKR